MELLILSTFIKKEYFRISVHSQYSSELKSRVSKYGVVDMESSYVYSSDSKALIQGIKNGLIAYLNNHYISPRVVGVGSSDFFDLKSINKCKSFLDIYMKELSIIKFNGSLFDFLSSLEHYSQRVNDAYSNLEFMDINSNIIKQIHSAIVANKFSIIFNKRSRYYVLSNIDTSNIIIRNIPIFEWVKVSNNEILFDIDVINAWKKDGRFKEVRGLIEIKFFNEFSLKNIKSR